MLFLALLLAATFAAGHALLTIGVRRRLLAAFETVEGLWLRFAAGFLFTSGWAVALAWFDRFEARALVAGPAAVFLAWLLRALLRWFRGGRTIRVQVDPLVVVAVGGCLLLGAWFYFPPVDVRLEARDPGVYYLAGAQLAQQGSLDWVDPQVAAMSPEARRYFFPPPFRHAINESYRFVGFYLEERASARVIPQALPVLPSWIAVGRLAGGVEGGLAATPALALFALLSVFFLGRRALGRWPAAVGSLLLAGSWLQAWFAHYGAAEIPAQALLAIALGGWLHYRRHGDPGFGWMGAAGFTLALFTKAESVLLLGPIAVVLLVDAARGTLERRQWIHFWLPLGGGVAASFVYARLELWPYYYDLLQQAELPPASFLLLTLGGTVALVASALGLSALPGRRRSTLESLVAGAGRFGVATGAAIALALVSVAAWGWLVRPGAWEAMYLDTGRNAGGWNAYNVVELGWALSPLALVLAVLGWAGLVLARGSLPRGAGAVAWLGLATTVPLVARRQIQPLLPWAYRRWLPLVIPLAWLVSGWLVVRVARWAAARLTGERSRLAAPLAAVLALALVAPVAAYQTEQALAYRQLDEMPGVAAILGELTAVTEPGSLLLFEPRTLRGLPRFEAALQIDRGRRVLRLPEGAVRTDLVREVVWRAARAEAPAYLVTTGYIDGFTEPAAERVHEFRWVTRRLVEEETNARFQAGRPLRAPVATEELVFRGRIYRLRVDGSLDALAGDLDVGDWDDLYLAGQDLHGPEVDGEGRTYRWTEGRAGFLLPGLDAGATEVVIVADPDTPERIGVQTLAVYLDGRALGSVQLQEGWREYGFSLPPGWSDDEHAGPPRLAIEVDPAFRLSEEIPGSSDRRIVGVKVDRVSWR